MASGAFRAALGTDTGGSVRLPASYTRTVGFKPSYGRISRWGVVAYANSLDTVGVIADKVETAQEVFLAADGPDPRDPTCVSEESRRRMKKVVAQYQRSKKVGVDGKRKLKIGVPREYQIKELSGKSRGVQEQWKRVLKACQKEGHILVPVSLPSTRHALSAYYIIAASEASSNLAKYDGVRYGPGTPPPAPTPEAQEGQDATSPVSQSDAAILPPILTPPPNQPLYSAHRGTFFGSEVQRRILLGSFALSASSMDNYFLQAQRIRSLVQRDFDRVFACPNPLHPDRQYDLSDMAGIDGQELKLRDKLGPEQIDILLVPTAPRGPPKVSSLTSASSTANNDGKGLSEQATEEKLKENLKLGWANDIFTVPASLAGLPAVSIPVESGVQNYELLVGMQVVGQYFDDVGVLEAAGEVARCNQIAVLERKNAAMVEKDRTGETAERKRAKMEGKKAGEDGKEFDKKRIGKVGGAFVRKIPVGKVSLESADLFDEMKMRELAREEARGKAAREVAKEKNMMNKVEGGKVRKLLSGDSQEDGKVEAEEDAPKEKRRWDD